MRFSTIFGGYVIYHTPIHGKIKEQIAIFLKFFISTFFQKIATLIFESKIISANYIGVYQRTYTTQELRNEIHYFLIILIQLNDQADILV